MVVKRLFVLVALAMPLASPGQSLVERAENDQLYLAENADPHMDAAFRQARESLEAFLAAWRSPAPGFTDFAVKVGVVEGDDTEYFWLSPFREESGAFVGKIDNTPRIVTSVALGQEIDFSKGQIVDWVYNNQGKMVGNFTACAMLKSAAESERHAFEQRFGLRCAP